LIILFEKISKRLSVDVDKVVFEKDEKESDMLKRSLKKETIKERTRLIYEESHYTCSACNGSGYYMGDKGYEYLCENCEGKGKIENW